MATYSRADNSPSTAPTRQKPIVLARLPRIGSTVAPNVVPKADRSPAPAAPLPQTSARAEIPLPEQLPRLELRGELEERIKLHVAEPLEEQTRPATVYFADREHLLANESKLADAPKSAAARSPSPKPKTRSSRSQPVTMSEKLFELHNQISPYAGLIVALALIASAGLLYWLSVGPAQLPTPHYDSFGTEAANEGLGYHSDPLPQEYIPQFTAELPKPEATGPSDNEWKEIALPVVQPAAEPTLLPPLEQPADEPQTEAAAEDSPYPKSLAAEPLDFAKVQSHSSTTQQLGEPVLLPEVARRANDSTNR